MKILLTLVVILSVLGNLNWALDAIDHNLVTMVSSNNNIQKFLYYLIAVSGLVLLILFIKNKLYI